MTPATDEQVSNYILQLLDDYNPHDWDETMIAVSVGCEAVGLSLYARQEDTCLYELIRLGEVKERWRGDMASLQRIRMPIPIERLQKTLWE